MLDALHDAGVSPDDPAVQAALVFVSRTQNIPSNRTTWSINGDKDGNVFTPLHMAVLSGQDACVDLLLREGACALFNNDWFCSLGWYFWLFVGPSRNDDSHAVGEVKLLDSVEKNLTSPRAAPV